MGLADMQGEGNRSRGPVLQGKASLGKGTPIARLQRGGWTHPLLPACSPDVYLTPPIAPPQVVLRWACTAGYLFQG